jgi:hypothetical protein
VPDREPKPKPRSALRSVVIGAALGTAVELPAVAAAIASSGMGHGHYVAARALFPLPMLLTRLEGQIGWVSGGLALLQFPLYGALLGWSRRRRTPGAAILLAVLHLVAAIACFAGTLPDFS